MIFYSLLALILLSPLPFGTNRPWSWSLWALVVALLSIAWVVKLVFHSNKNVSFQNMGRFVDVIFLFSVVVIWGVVQSGPMFSNAIHPLWSMVDASLPFELNYSISLMPVDAVTSCMRLLSYALVFVMTFYFCQSQAKARVVFFGLMTAGFFYSLYGLYIQIGGFNTILWFDKWAYSKSLTSTFVSRNHFSTYAGLTLLCAIALVHDSVRVSSKYHLSGYLGLQRFSENLITRTWGPLLVLFVIGTALILAQSRGGFFSAMLGMVVLLVSLNVNPRSRNIYSTLFLVGFILVGGIVFYVSADALLQRLDTRGLFDQSRAQVYELTWGAISSNPWLGFGLGSFEEVFPLYKTIDISGSVYHPILWDYAHNTYLEVIFELGFPVALLLFYCFFKLAWVCARGLLVRRKNWIYPATGLAATCLIAAHATVDFSMQIPAVAYTYVLLMGASCAQSFPTPKKIKRTSDEV